MTALDAYKHDATGRSTGRRKTNRRTAIGEQFAPRTIRMLRSPAWRVLSLSARRILDRVEIELADHGGTDNGRLPVTYDDFERYGIHRHSIAAGIREAVALGFLLVTEPGRAGNAEWRKPNLFRVTYRNSPHDGPTNEWERIDTDEQAEATARAARRVSSKTQWRKAPTFGGGNRHRKQEIKSAENAPTSDGAQPTTTLDIAGEGEQRSEDQGERRAVREGEGC